MIHPHWFYFIAYIFGLLIALILPFILYIFIADTTILAGDVTIPLTVPTSVGWFLASAWMLIIWMQLGTAFSDYYLDGWIVTNKRIMDIEQRSFFSRQVSSFRMERIQDVTTDIHGIIATLLNFGEVHVQTAGDNREFVMKHAPNPREIKQVILGESDKSIDRTQGIDGVNLK